MAEIFEADAQNFECPFNNWLPCRGAKCMAFRFVGPAADRCETDNLVDTAEGQRPQGVPSMPEGDGWEMDGPAFPKGYHRSDKDKLPKAQGQRWARPRPQVKGFCGRVGGDGGYF